MKKEEILIRSVSYQFPQNKFAYVKSEYTQRIYDKNALVIPIKKSRFLIKKPRFLIKIQDSRILVKEDLGEESQGVVIMQREYQRNGDQPGIKYMLYGGDATCKMVLENSSE